MTGVTFWRILELTSVGFALAVGAAAHLMLIVRTLLLPGVSDVRVGRGGKILGWVAVACVPLSAAGIIWTVQAVGM